MAASAGAARAPGHTGRDCREPGFAGFRSGLPAAASVGEFRDQRKLLTQIIKARTFYTSKVRAGSVSNPKRERSQLVPSPMHSACLLSNCFVPGAL